MYYRESYAIKTYFQRNYIPVKMLIVVDKYVKRVIHEEMIKYVDCNNMAINARLMMVLIWLW